MNYILPFQEKEFEKGVKKILEFGLMKNSYYTKKFEKEFAKQFNYKYAIAMPSGTDSITATMIILNSFARCHRVLVPSLTVKEIYQAMTMSGVRTYFMDISRELPVPGQEEITKAIIKHNADAVFYVHTAGLSKLHEIDLPDDIILIEDCSHAHGIKELGHRGLVSIYSFFTTKVLGGGVGIIATDNKELYRLILKFVRHDRNSPVMGYPYDVPELHALIAYLDTKYWKKLVKIRQEQAEMYRNVSISPLQDKMPYEPTHYKFTVTKKPPENVKLTGFTHKPPLFPTKNSVFWANNHWNLYIGRTYEDLDIVKKNVEMIRHEKM